MRARRIASPVVGIAALAGAIAVTAAPSCSSGGDSAIVVHVQGPTALPATLPPIFRLHAIVSNDDTSDSKMFPMTAPTQAIAMPTAFSITLPRSRTGELDVAVDALDATGNILAYGAGSATISVGGTSEVTVTLTAGISLCGNGHVDDGEQCDDGDRVTSGGCDFRCQSRVGDAGADVLGHDAGTGGTGTGGSGGKGGAGAGGSGAGGVNGAGGTGTGGRGAGGSGAGGSGAGGSGAGGSGTGGGGGCTIELLNNGTFDSGNIGWTATSTAGSTVLIFKAGDAGLGGVTPSSPSYAAALGRTLMNGQETLSQPITVPSGANTITIQGFVQIPISTTVICPTCNTAVLEIVHNPDTVNVKSWSSTDGTGAWMAFGTTIDATPLRGTTVLFQMRAVATSTATLAFYFDSLSAKIDRCGP